MREAQATLDGIVPTSASGLAAGAKAMAAAEEVCRAAGEGLNALHAAKAKRRILGHLERMEPRAEGS